MLPPLARSITGYCTVLKMSPVAMTSERRNNTIVSVSVLRLRVVIQHHRLAVERKVATILEVGIERLRRRRHAALRHPQRRILVRDDRCRIAVHRAPGLRELLVAARAVARPRRVDDPADVLLRDRPHGGNQLVRHADAAGIDDQHAVLTRLHGDVAGRRRSACRRCPAPSA